MFDIQAKCSASRPNNFENWRVHTDMKGPSDAIIVAQEYIFIYI